MKLIPAFFILTLLFIPGKIQLTGQGHEERMTALDVQSYRFQIALNDSTDVIQGNAQIVIFFKTAPDKLELDLAGRDQQGTGMVIDQLLEDGSPVDYLHRREQIEIDLQRVVPGSTRKYEIKYHGIPRDGLIISENKFGDRTFFGDNWPNRAHHWLPVVDHPSDKATVEFLVHAPEHYGVVSNGRKISESRQDGYLLSHWGTEVPLPTKLMVIGVSPFAVQQVDTVSGIPVSTWVYPQNSREGFYDFSIAVPPLAFFQSYIGPYPFSKLANVQSKTVYGGMENASCIFYSEGTVNGEGDHEALFAHEIAHQWFGDAVTELNWHHIWISEGFATYLTDLYLEKAHGRGALLSSMQQEKRSVFRYAMRKSAPIIDTTLSISPALLNGNSYDKAAWVLHMLRKELGDEKFQEIVRVFYTTYRYGNALTEDFQEVAESVSGKELDRFFHQWFYRPGYPVLSYRYKNRRNGVVLTIRQHQPQGSFEFPLEIELIDSKGQRQRETLTIDDSKQVFRLHSAFKPSGIVLDPDGWLLFEMYR